MRRLGGRCRRSRAGFFSIETAPMCLSYPLMVLQKVSRSFSLSKKVDKSFDFSFFENPPISPGPQHSQGPGTWEAPVRGVQLPQKAIFGEAG